MLASVAGTEEAHDAVVDAQIPQTAKVDRASATCTVKYNGEPQFEKIEGTSLYLAKNTSSTVLKSGNNYYCVENAVWFKSATPTDHGLFPTNVQKMLTIYPQAAKPITPSTFIFTKPPLNMYT